MTLQNDLKSADLEKKLRQLEDRESALNQRENILEREKQVIAREKVFSDAESKLDVLNKQIKAKELILSQRNDEIENAANTHLVKKSEFEAKTKANDKALKVQQQLIADATNSYKSVCSTIKEKEKLLKSIKDEISDSKSYLAEQESISENIISEWNMRLTEFAKESDIIRDEKNKLSADIIRLEQEKSALKDECQKIEDNLDNLSDSYDKKVDEYKEKLRVLNDKCIDKQNEYDGLSNAIESRELAIAAGEKSLRLRLYSIGIKERELEQKERRLKANFGMSGIDYEDAV